MYSNLSKGGVGVQLDSSVIQRAIDGDDESFLTMVYTYKIDLYKTALAYLRNENDALEAMQEVTYRAYQNISKLRNKRYAKTWLIRIMINYCNDQFNKNKRFIYNEKLITIKGVPDDYSRMELEDALFNIDERSREIIMLMYFHDLKIKEIADVMERPEGTIKTWLHQALKSLRSELEEKGGSAHV